MGEGGGGGFWVFEFLDLDEGKVDYGVLTDGYRRKRFIIDDESKEVLKLENNW